MFEQLKNLQKLGFDDLHNAFLGLEKRQQVILILAGVFIFLVILWLPSRMLSGKIHELEKRHQNYLQQAKELKSTLDEYAALQGALNQSASGSEDALGNFIYNTAETFGIPKTKVGVKTGAKMPASESFEQYGKEVDIKTVPFDQLMRFLAAVEDNAEFPVVVKHLTLKADRKNRQVISQATFSVNTIKAKK